MRSVGLLVVAAVSSSSAASAGPRVGLFAEAGPELGAFSGTYEYRTAPSLAIGTHLVGLRVAMGATVHTTRTIDFRIGGVLDLVSWDANQGASGGLEVQADRLAAGCWRAGVRVAATYGELGIDTEAQILSAGLRVRHPHVLLTIDGVVTRAGDGVSRAYGRGVLFGAAPTGRIPGYVVVGGVVLAGILAGVAVASLAGGIH